MDWLKKAPTSVTITVLVIVGTLLLAGLIGFTTLIYAGKDVTEFRQMINTLMIFATTGFSGVAAVAGVGAAKSSAKTEDQTNGASDAERDAIARAAAKHAVALYQSKANQPGGL
jgi:hypothetical protein